MKVGRANIRGVSTPFGRRKTNTPLGIDPSIGFTCPVAIVFFKKMAAKARCLSDPNSNFIDYPEVADNRLFSKHFEDSAKDRQNMRLVLPGKAKNQQTGMLLRRVESQIGEICVECHQNTLLRFTDSGKVRVLTTLQPLIVDRKCIVSRCAKLLSQLHWEILVNLEFHWSGYAGNVTTRSRARSAA